MCGICGIKGLPTEERNKYIDDMLILLHHRGPDEKGKYFDEDISLGMTRLSIIDLKTGSQPIYNENKSLVVTCNGEIYNFYTLRDFLLKKHHRFYTDSDAEVLVHLYEEYGTDCLKYIKGMFSFIIWDKNKKIIFIARDRFGIKPLYYYHKNGIFAFSSEIKALLKLPFISKELDTRAVDLYFSLEYIPSPYSIFKNIYKLKPAHYIILKDNDIKIYCYWHLNNQSINNRISFHDAEDRLKELFQLSVKEHLIGDVPLGIFLSGGIDSSSLVALAKKMYNDKLLTFSIGFKEKSFDESKYAHIASKHFKTEHRSYIFTIKDFINNFHAVTSLLDEPLGDLSIFPTYMLSKFSRQYIKVALSGEGADELFMGYPTYTAHRYMNLFSRLPHNLKKQVKYLINLLPTSFSYFSLDFRLKQFIKGMDKHNPASRHMLWMGAFSEEDKGKLFTGLFKKRINSTNAISSFMHSRKLTDMNIKTTNKQIQYLDIFGYLSESLLVKSDRASMFSSLELRVPFLDHELVEFIYSLNSNYIYHKKILKKSMEHIVPSAILTRSKQGFPIPFSNWIRNKDIYGIFNDFFSKEFIQKQGFFNYNYVNQLLSEHLEQKKDNRKKLRTYIMFQAWHKNWQ